MIINGKKFKTIKETKDFYYENIPHEISASEIKQINPELFKTMREIELVLVALGQITNCEFAERRDF